MEDVHRKGRKVRVRHEIHIKKREGVIFGKRGIGYLRRERKKALATAKGTVKKRPDLPRMKVEEKGEVWKGGRERRG